MDLINNKKASIKYAPLEHFSAGMELMGSEVKSLRAKHGSLEGARVVVRGGEAFITGMTIPPYQPANTAENYDPERPRRLLLTKKEMLELASAEARKGLTIVPLSVYNIRGILKARVAIVRGKTDIDRREDVKQREASREADRVLKNR